MWLHPQQISAGGNRSAEIGEVVYFAGSAIPSGWLACDGSAVSRTTYAKLFTAVGETFGAGDGDTTFNVPDLRGRAPIGAGQGDGLTLRTIGEVLGEEVHQLTEDEMAAHTHSKQYGNQRLGAHDSGSSTRHFGAAQTQSTGGDAAHNNMQPFLSLKPIIFVGV